MSAVGIRRFGNLDRFRSSFLLSAVKILLKEERWLHTFDGHGLLVAVDVYNECVIFAVARNDLVRASVRPCQSWFDRFFL